MEPDQVDERRTDRDRSRRDRQDSRVAEPAGVGGTRRARRRRRGRQPRRAPGAARRRARGRTPSRWPRQARAPRRRAPVAAAGAAAAGSWRSARVESAPLPRASRVPRWRLQMPSDRSSPCPCRAGRRSVRSSARAGRTRDRRGCPCATRTRPARPPRASRRSRSPRCSRARTAPRGRSARVRGSEMPGGSCSGRRRACAAEPRARGRSLRPRRA